MEHEIDSIPEVIAAQQELLGPAVKTLVEQLEPDVGHPPEIILTGCGDSYFAGLATRLALERYAGVRCRAVEALELARYDVRYVPTRPRPVLFALSYSGEVGRTIDAARTASQFGWRTVAVTGQPTGRLAAATSDRLVLDVPTRGFSPGTSTYVAMLVALQLVCAELATALGREAEAAAVRDALAAAPVLARQTLEESARPAMAVAERWESAPLVTFLGAGPSRATAAFGAAKLFEGPQRIATVQDLEEWAHEEYFISGPTTPVAVVAPAGASFDRAQELLDELAFIEAPVAVVTDDVAAVQRPERIVLPIAAGLPEPFSPILSALPLALSAYFLAERLGTHSYGFPTEEHEREHYATIHRDTPGTPA